MTRLPPPTEAQLRAAFELLAWRDCTFEAAMGDAIRARILKACASVKRKEDFLRNTTRRERLVRRCDPRNGTWATQRVPCGFEESQPRLV